jgi:hypothetical protein
VRRLILICDNEPALRGLVRAALADDGYELHEARDGDESLELARALEPDLVVLDMMMPGRTGIQVLEELRTEERFRETPVIMLTARAQAGDRMAAAEAGASRFISKPFSPIELGLVVEELLAGNGRANAAALGAANFLAKPFSQHELRDAIIRVLPDRSGSVLVVDDEESVRHLVRESLRGNGFETLEARGGEEALARIAEQKPDALILDLIMPGVDGFAVLEQLQADPETRVLPVIVLTAKRLSEEERQRLLERTVALLEKSSYSAAELRRLVRRALAQ